MRLFNFLPPWAMVIPLLVGPAAHAQSQNAPPVPSGTSGVGPLAAHVEIEPRAVEILKAMSARLAAANSMTFTATTTYESPARTGEPLAY